MTSARPHFPLKFIVVLLMSVGCATAYGQLGIRPAQPVSQSELATAKDQLELHRQPRGTNESDVKPCKVPIGWTPTNAGPDVTLCFWNQTQQEYLKYAKFVSSTKSVTAATDIVSDAFGPLRVALSTAVAATTKTSQTGSGTTPSPTEPTPEQDRALNLLASNGGNLAVTLSYPIYYHPIGSTGTFLWNSYARIASDIAAFGGGSETTVGTGDLNANLELAIAEFHADLLSYQRNFDVLGYGKVSGIFGTQKFAAALSPTAKRAFAHVQAGAGLRVSDLITIYVTWNHYPHRIPGSGGAVTFALGK